MSLPESDSRRMLSRLLPQRLQVTFAAEGVLLARIDLFGRPASQPETLALAALTEGAPVWQAWLTPLAQWLQGHPQQHFELRVLLSDRFVRYQHLPWRNGISGQRERQAWAGHRFREVYGELAGQWQIALSDDMPGSASMACAMDSELLDALRGIDKRVRLLSVQPLFVAAYNRARHKCKGRQFWFVHVEPGRVCMALLKSGQSAAVRNEASNENWPQAVAGINRRMQPDLHDTADLAAVPMYVSGDLQGVPPPLSLGGHPLHLLETAA